MNLEVFREDDTVFIRDTDTWDEWPLPAEVWSHLVGIFMASGGLPPVWGPISAQQAIARDTPGGRAT